jgi:hypothetical protein
MPAVRERERVLARVPALGPAPALALAREPVLARVQNQKAGSTNHRHRLRIPPAMR